MSSEVREKSCDHCGRCAEDDSNRVPPELAYCASCGSDICGPCLKAASVKYGILSDYDAEYLEFLDTKPVGFLHCDAENGTNSCGRCAAESGCLK